MIKPGIPWLPLVVLGGLMLPGAGHAQRPLDGELLLELLQRIERLEAEVRQIRGDLEIYHHQLERWERDAAADYSPEAPRRPPTVEWMDSDSSSEVETLPKPVIPPIDAIPPTSETERVDFEEQADFATALNEFREGRFREAIMEFRQFLSDYPESSLAGEARYWLGESYYLRRDHEAAKEMFIDLGLRDPQSARLPDALLKLGYLYGQEGDIDRAREVLQKLARIYPDTQAARLAERRLQTLR